MNSSVQSALVVTKPRHATVPSASTHAGVVEARESGLAGAAMLNTLSLAPWRRWRRHGSTWTRARGRRAVDSPLGHFVAKVSDTHEHPESGAHCAGAPRLLRVPPPPRAHTPPCTCRVPLLGRARSTRSALMLLSWSPRPWLGAALGCSRSEPSREVRRRSLWRASNGGPTPQRRRTNVPPPRILGCFAELRRWQWSSVLAKVTS